MFLNRLDNIEYSVFLNLEHDVNYHFEMVMTICIQLIRNYSPYTTVNNNSSNLLQLRIVTNLQSQIRILLLLLNIDRHYHILSGVLHQLITFLRIKKGQVP